MTKQAAELTYAVRFSVLAKYFGQLCLIVAALTVVPLVVSLIYGEILITVRYTIVLVVLIGLGGLLGRLRAPAEVQVNEAMVIVAFMFLFTPLVMTFPVMGAGLTFPDALFETISAATTTGLSTVKSLQDQPQTFLFARAWMQWYGGLGIVVLTVALLFRPGSKTKQFAVTEAKEEDLVGGTKAHARRVLTVYTFLSVTGFLLLLVMGTSPFNAMLYSLAAVSTGGFAPHDASLAALSGPFVHYCIILICLTGAVPLRFYHRLYKKDLRPNSDTLQLRWIIYMGVLVSLFLGISMVTNGTEWTQALHHAPAIAFSAQTTAGFSTMDISQLSAASKLLLIMNMAIGGGVGSTAGGIKILRLLIVIHLVWIFLRKACASMHAREKKSSISIFQTMPRLFAFIAMGILYWRSMKPS